MSIVRNDDGNYQLNWLNAFWGVHVHELAGAWVPVPGTNGEPSARRFGWVQAGLSAPHKGDRYIVEFSGARRFRILAYMDRFGRVFSADGVVLAPPAREPDVAFARFDDVKMPPGDEAGCIQVRKPKGGTRQVAQYRREKGRYRLFDTWYDFGEHAGGLSYADALARCYLAFVVRPAEGARAVPPRDFEMVRAALREKNPLVAMERIVREVGEAREDPALRPPALVECLADWLQEADLPQVLASVRAHAGAKAVPLRLVRTARYANTYYLGTEDEEAAAAVTAHQVWALEAALNRFLLVGEQFGDDAALAAQPDCGAGDAYVMAGIAAQVLDAAHAVDEQGDPAGEWLVRKNIGEAMENLRLPVRYFATFKVDVDSGVVAFDVTAPDASLMPARYWDFSVRRWVAATEAQRADQALRYAQHLGILLAAAAFRSSRLVGAVLVRACPLAAEKPQDAPGSSLRDDAPDGGDAEGASTPAGSSGAAPRAAGTSEPFYRVLFDRELFCADDAYKQAAAGDPAPLYAAQGALFGAQALGDPFDVVDHMGSARVRRDAPEGITVRFSGAAAKALAARSTHDLRIYYEGILRHTGETLADCVVGAASATEAIRYVRAAQEEADDPRVFEACTRLMTALVEGTVDAADQNAVVTCFIGEDRYHRALMQARSVASHDPSAAVSILRTVIAEAESGGKFSDNAETVYRVFDSYASRVVYNLQRPRSDMEKHVELAPVSLLLCYLDAVKLLGESFEHADEALHLGRRTMEMAPTFTVAFRQTARVCMLMGDLENASRILKRCLEFALQSDEIAIAYYQLAYVEWKAGRPLAGAACYLKSIMVSPVYAPQSTVELQELMSEEGLENLPKDKVNEVLGDNGIPIAPAAELLDKLDAAAQSAIDANVFSVGRSLLSARLRHRPDDALANVMRAL